MKLPAIALSVISLVVITAPVCFSNEEENAEEAKVKWDVSQPGYSVEPTTATIDVTEGTWMSLDVAPDGKSIVFDLLGDIYRIPFEGGKAESILSGHAWDKQPRFSPDGHTIAFTSDRAGGENIWTMNLEGRDMHQVTFETFRLLNNPTWSPEGDYLAARKHFTTSRSLGAGEIRIYHARGNKENKGVPVVERPDPTFQKELGEPMYAPTGDVIYLKTSANELWNRVKRNKNRPLLATDNPKRSLEEHLKVREPLYSDVAKMTFVTDQKTPDAIALEMHQTHFGKS